jgi:hypothetical protein
MYTKFTLWGNPGVHTKFTLWRIRVVHTKFTSVKFFGVVGCAGAP